MTQTILSPKSNEDIAACLSVVVPAFNEATTIVSVVQSVLAQRPVQQVIVVDDASRDDTWDLLRAFASDTRVILRRHEFNQGKGAALRTGFRLATAPYVLVQDADLEYDPRQYHILLAPMLEGLADVVFGSRFSGGGAHRVLYYWHAVGNKILTTLSNMVTDINLTDMETCFKLFRRQVLQQVTIEEDRFGFEVEVTAKISKMDLRIYEVPISYFGRSYAEGKKIGWRDGFSALRCVLKYGLMARGSHRSLTRPQNASQESAATVTHASRPVVSPTSESAG
jgi:glycosyltransferase involved in cell wall biosynthesis